MDIKLFNTMSKKLEIFIPIKKGEVSMYTCGPTVYHFAHIGNLRTYVSQDIMKRMFILNGYKVFHIMNITDVGHLTSDADTGEDKMEKGSIREGKTVWEIAKYYTDIFMNDIKNLNIIPANKYTKATEYITGQINLIKKLEELGYTYKIEDDGIYYDTSKFMDYGKLGGQNLDELKAGARIDFQDKKKNISDFALWKFSPKHEKRQMEWDSPWGVGFPGWHIECSAMSLCEIGERMDIHSGGVDHIKIHHTNEIAQVEPVIGHKWVNYWIHMEFLNDVSGKMSKSKGDFLTLQKLIDKGYDPIIYRYFLLLASYRKQINFSFELLDSAKNSYNNLIKKIAKLYEANNDIKDENIIDEYKIKILNVINNDLNTADTISSLQELLKDDAVNDATKLEIIKFYDELLGLKFIENSNNLYNQNTKQETIPNEIIELANQRHLAKQNKDYTTADKLRETIETKGYTITDTSNGYEIKKK